MESLLHLALLATIGLLLTEAALSGLKPRHVVMPENTNHTEGEWLEILRDQVSSPEQVFEFQNDSEPQPDFAGKLKVRKPGLRITNGNVAVRGQFPWQVAVITENSIFCGGSLISRTWILTAAHCSGSHYNIKLGANRVDVQELGSLTVSSGQSIVHPDYNASSLRNDIALIHLPLNVLYTSLVIPVKLPGRSQQQNSLVGQKLRVSGWGRYSDGEPGISAYLQYVDVTAINNTDCARVFGSFVASTNLCVATSWGQSTCKGDSGGPLVYLTGDLHTQVGIVSFGARAGCELGYPAVFTRVTSYLNWIQSVTGILID